MLASTGNSTIYAAGDVCSFPSLRTGSQVRIEHWDVAQAQGRIVAANMLDRFRPYTKVPFFWSVVFGNSIQFVGHAAEILDRVTIEGDVSSMSFVAYYSQDDTVMAVATVNKDEVSSACLALMQAGKMPKTSEFIVGKA